MSPSYAIVESGGKQYRVEKGDRVVVDRLPSQEGDKVALRAVMFRDDGKVVLEPSELEKVKVEAVVASHQRGPKIKVFKYRPKKGYRRRAGHRSELTELEVTDVRMLSRRPSTKKDAARSQAKGKSSSGAGKGSTKGGSSKQRASSARESSAKKEG